MATILMDVFLGKLVLVAANIMENKMNNLKRRARGWIHLMSIEMEIARKSESKWTKAYCLDNALNHANRIQQLIKRGRVLR